MANDPYNYEDDDLFVIEECVDDATAYAGDGIHENEYTMMVVQDEDTTVILVQHEQLGIVEGTSFDAMGVSLRWKKG